MPGNPTSRRGRSALVTGAGTGIGRGIALALARRGYHIALVGRRAGPLQEVAHLVERYGVRTAILPTDLSNPADLATIVERARLALGPLDLLVNNAGVLAGGNLHTLTSEEISRAISTNLLAPIELTRQAFSDLRECRGAVVFIGSTMSFAPMPSAAVYSATKSAIRGVVDSLRYELEPAGVRVLLAYPPPTDTAMVRGMDTSAGLSRFPRRNPDYVGEQIVRTLQSGKKELIFGMDRTIRLLYHIAPGIVTAIFRSQSRRFEKMMTQRQNLHRQGTINRK